MAVLNETLEFYRVAKLQLAAWQRLAAKPDWPKHQPQLVPVDIDFGEIEQRFPKDSGPWLCSITSGLSPDANGVVGGRVFMVGWVRASELVASDKTHRLATEQEVTAELERQAAVRRSYQSEDERLKGAGARHIIMSPINATARA